MQAWLPGEGGGLFTVIPHRQAQSQSQKLEQLVLVQTILVAVHIVMRPLNVEHTLPQEAWP